MANKYVDFITDEHLITCISELYEKYYNAKVSFSKKNLYKNKVDIFKMLFDKKFNNLSDEQLINKEIERQVDRTIVNAIGTFHERILAGVKNFEKVDAGIDIKSKDDKIFIELKNKHNTIKGEDSKSIFMKLLGEIEKHPNSKAYFARILDTKSTNKEWSFTHKKVKFENKNVFIISGDQLYKIVTGNDNSLVRLYQTLPKAIDDYLETKEPDDLCENIYSTALVELQEDTEKSGREIIDEITYSNYNYYLGFDKLNK